MGRSSTQTAKRWWRRSGLNLRMIVILCKSALAPTIVLCLLLSNDIASYYGFVGYVAAILAINPVLPQGQYIELMLRQILAVCLASATTLLQLFCVVKAREDTSEQLPPPPLPLSGTAPPPVPYNSSAAAVAGVWLVVLIFLVCYVRSSFPQATMPCINFSVTVVVTSSVAPTLPNMSAAMTFVKQLLVVNLTGLTASIAVNLILLPSTNRKVFKQGIVNWRDCIETCLKERAEPVGEAIGSQNFKEQASVGHATSSNPKYSKQTPKDPVIALLEVVSALERNLPYAKREISFSKLNDNELCDLMAYQYNILQPALSLMSGLDLLQKLLSDADSSYDRSRLSNWYSHVLEGLSVLGHTLDHGLRALDISPWSTKLLPSRDLESAKLGSELDIEGLRARLREVEAALWSEIGKMRTINSFGTTSAHADASELLLFGVLQVTNSLHASSGEALKLAQYAENKVSDGTLSQRRLIIPNLSHVWKPLIPFVRDKDAGGALIVARSRSAAGGFAARLRGIFWILKSPHAGFATRIAIAVLCSEILAFIHQTQRWYQVQRGVWASITIAIVTNRTIGQSVFGVLSQVAGTLVGAILSMVVWYIVDQHIPGVIVFYFLAMILATYPAQRSPTLLSLSMVSSVTLTLLVGYQIETEQIGKEAIVANGQPYYPPYILSWLDVLAILAGVGIAAFWTLFPYPILESDELVAEFGRSLEGLAELYLRTHHAVTSRIQGKYNAERAAKQVEETLVLQKRAITGMARLRELLNNTRFQIPIGGQRFPTEQYVRLHDHVERTFRALSVTYYGARVFDEIPTDLRNSEWLTELRRVASPNTDSEARTVSALLACAMAISRRQPLWQLFEAPEAATLLTAIRKSDLLNTKHIVEPGYSALASIHASALTVSEEIKSLVNMTSDLVGRLEIDLDWSGDGDAARKVV